MTLGHDTMRFLIFITLFLLIYGGMHLYLYRRLLAGLPVLRGYRSIVIPLLALMLLMPITIRWLESYGFYGLARPLALVGFLWMGTLLLFCFYAGIADLLVWLGRWLPVGGGMAAPSRRLALVLVCALLSAGYGYVEAGRIRVERVAVVTPLAPASATPFRVVQLSDVHIGLITRPVWLQQVVDRVNSLDPDLVVITGDLVDGNVDGTAGFVQQLRGLKARDGVYGVTGNHEFIAGIEKSLQFFSRSGIEVLRGESRQVNDWLTLIGVDDPGGHGGDRGLLVDEAQLLGARTGERYRLLLKHRPIVDPQLPGLFDLQLSGHVHQGQIFPFVVLTRLVYPVASGFNTLVNGSRLYVNRGTGTWGPPIRFLAPPEITLFEFSPSVASAS